MIWLTVDYVLSAPQALTHARCVLERNITEILWNGADGNRQRPMVDGATLAQPLVSGGVNCPSVKDIADPRSAALRTHALCST